MSLSEKVQKEFSSEKSAKAEQLHLLVHLGSITHSQSNHLFRRRSVARYLSPLIAVLLVLVHFRIRAAESAELHRRQNKFCSRSLEILSTKSRTTYWFWFTQKTIGCSRIYHLQSRREANVFSTGAGAENTTAREVSQVDYSRHLEKQVSWSDLHTMEKEQLRQWRCTYHKSKRLLIWYYPNSFWCSGISTVNPDEIFSSPSMEKEFQRNLRQENLNSWQVHSTRNFW